MNCPRCQTPIPEGANACPSCGEDQTRSDQAPPPQKSRMALAAERLAWLGWLAGGISFALLFLEVFGLLVPLLLLSLASFVLSFVLGVVAFVRVLGSRGRLVGRSHAVNAMVLSGVVFALLYGVVWLFRDMEVRRSASRTASDMRSMEVALAAYRIDCGTFPLTLPQLTTPLPCIGALPEGGGPDGGGLGPLTYHPFNARAEDGTTLYDACVLLQEGPDKKADIVPARDLLSDRYLFHEDVVVRLLPKTYDATNGTYSAGDILRFSVDADKVEGRAGNAGRPGSAGAPTGTSDSSATESVRR